MATISKKAKVWGGVGVILAGTGLGLGLSESNAFGPTPPPSVTPSVNATCASDVTSGLNSFFAGLSNGTTVELASGGCYLVSGTGVDITGLSNITIIGNGAKFYQSSYSSGVKPVLTLNDDSSILVTGLTLQGPSSSGDAGTEGDYGVYITGGTGLALIGDTIEDVEGDAVISQFDASWAYPKGVTITDDTLTGIGYRGITIESVNGETIAADTVSNVSDGLLDMEDDFSAHPGDLSNVLVEYTQSSAIGGPSCWVTDENASASAPETNDRFLSNTLSGTPAADYFCFEGGASNIYNGITVSGNRSATTCGGTCFASILAEYVKNLNVQGNTLASGYRGVYAASVTTAFVKHNSFLGAPTLVDTSGGGTTGVTSCSNLYATSSMDSAC